MWQIGEISRTKCLPQTGGTLMNMFKFTGGEIWVGQNQKLHVKIKNLCIDLKLEFTSHISINKENNFMLAFSQFEYCFVCKLIVTTLSQIVRTFSCLGRELQNNLLWECLNFDLEMNKDFVTDFFRNQVY